MKLRCADTQRHLMHYVFQLQYELNLSFMEAIKGVNKEMSARTRVTCDRCSGSRAEPGSSFSTCTTCNGSGEVEAIYVFRSGSNIYLFKFDCHIFVCFNLELLYRM